MQPRHNKNPNAESNKWGSNFRGQQWGRRNPFDLGENEYRGNEWRGEGGEWRGSEYPPGTMYGQPFYGGGPSGYGMPVQQYGLRYEGMGEQDFGQRFGRMEYGPRYAVNEPYVGVHRLGMGQYFSNPYVGGYGMHGPIEDLRQFPKGPKGYTRSDERIKEDICDRLSLLFDVDASDVEVGVEGGEVTLTGTVPDRAMKVRIEFIADQIPGVKDVANQLKIKRGEHLDPAGELSANDRTRRSSKS